MSESPNLSALPGLRGEIEAHLAKIALLHEPFYVETARPGREDEARIYDRTGNGVAKPTCERPDARRPLAEFIVGAPALLRRCLAALEEQGKEIADAKEECPVSRMQDYLDAPLLTAVKEQVSQCFRYQSRAEAAEARCAALEDQLGTTQGAYSLAAISRDRAEARIAALEAEKASVDKLAKALSIEDVLRQDGESETGTALRLFQVIAAQRVEIKRIQQQHAALEEALKGLADEMATEADDDRGHGEDKLAATTQTWEARIRAILDRAALTGGKEGERGSEARS